MYGGNNFHAEPVQPRVAGRAAARAPSFKPFVLATALKQGISPLTTLQVEAGLDLPRQQVLVRPQLRGRVPRADRPHQGDQRLRQHRVRAADEDRRAGERRAGRRSSSGSRAAPELLRDRARRRAGQPARDGARVRVVRERRLPRRRLGLRQRAARGDGDRRTVGQVVATNTPAPQAGALVRGGRAADADARGRRHLRHRHGGRAAGTGRSPARPGTTENYGDAWFVGYTPQLVTAVWVGYPNKLVPMLHEFHGAAGRRRHVSRR